MGLEHLERQVGQTGQNPALALPTVEHHCFFCLLDLRPRHWEFRFPYSDLHRQWWYPNVLERHGRHPHWLPGLSNQRTALFIRDLIFYIVVTPLVFLFIKWTRLYGILALCLLHLTVNRLVPEGFIFFTTGAWFRLSRKNIVEVLEPERICFYLIAILSFAGLVLIQYHSDSGLWQKIVKFVFLVSGIAASFCGVARLLDAGKTRVIPFLAGSSFFIFASHEVLILQNISTPVIKALLPDGIAWDCIAFFAVPALTVAICIGLLFIMQRILPRTTAILTGGRRVEVTYNA